MPDGRSRIAVALDAADRDRLLALARIVAPAAGVLKVGLEAFCAHGPALVAEVAALAPVFLDLKLHDIPNTVGGAAAAAARTGASILNVHSGGGREMMRTAGERAREAAAAAALPPPRVIAVTVLTSLDASALAEVGLSGTPREAALRLAVLAQASGLDGVVCSPEEIVAIRAACGPGFLLVVPGIRPAGSAAGDQKRIATPGSAARAGADLLVIGRPITGAADPAAAAREIAREIEAGLTG
ncbi:MAG: orotidine-5'-phosphate decarboxylase [Thermoanaerobaculia bacterium]|nr:orotidine-5'-phosphate decarboxylase [Thermoanaerobaculia bacterium]